MNRVERLLRRAFARLDGNAYIHIVDRQIERLKHMDKTNLGKMPITFLLQQALIEAFPCQIMIGSSVGIRRSSSFCTRLERVLPITFGLSALCSGRFPDTLSTFHRGMYNAPVSNQVAIRRIAPASHPRPDCPPRTYIVGLVVRGVQRIGVLFW
jgi:hypothetical protein